MSQPLRVIIADDEMDVLRFYRAILTQLGHIVLAEADDGYKLIEACRKLDPDVVISDVTMPGLDGISAMEQLKAGSTTAFIFVTGTDDAAMRQRAENQQVLAYLIKPIKTADLAPVLSNITA